MDSILQAMGETLKICDRPGPDNPGTNLEKVLKLRSEESMNRDSVAKIKGESEPRQCCLSVGLTVCR